ncbi:peroxiredoxin [Pseudomonas putida]|uniref:peroxiredoxin n=1 Tax=Pseudomonas putida TaxID=303 RepID=UPI0007B6D02D|nr:peroxiredoxin [Pseudomonas putida]ANC04038.1 peroxiredoxin [Pseudomonas putida]
MIKCGDALPDVMLFEFAEDSATGRSGPVGFSLKQRWSGKRIVLFGLPGAFTPTCSERHVPGYLDAAQELHSVGIDEIVCISVNDAYVMKAWGDASQPEPLISMISDGNGDLTKALGLTQDLKARGMGVRSHRYAMIVDHGYVTYLRVEEPGKFEVSDARTMLENLPDSRLLVSA